jgi:hypothetical protein
MFWHRICKNHGPMEVCKDWRPILALIALVISILSFGLFVTGCQTQEETSPPRSATEQLLISAAADQALATANLNAFAGQRVYFDFTYFEGYDSKYAEGEIRDAFSRAGALLAPDDKSADVIVEPRVGAYSIDTNSAFFGIPSIPLPIPSTSEEPITPQVAFYQRQSQFSYAKIALLAYSHKTHAHIYSSGSLDGKTYNTFRSILFISWWRSNVPEKNKDKYKQKYIVWQPQYDLQNMPAVSTNTPISTPTGPADTNSTATSTNAVK